MSKPPFRVTLLLWLVLFLTAWNALRLWTALAWHNVLNEFSAQPKSYDHSHQRCFLGGHWAHSSVGHLAEKSLDCENAPRGIGRLHGLVLERAADLAKSTSKLAVRCYSKSGFNYLHPIHYKIIDERGS